MKKPLPELIAFLENYNRWRRGSFLHEQPVPEELGLCIDQAVEMLKTMNKTSKEEIIELHTGKTVEEIEKNNRIVKTLVSWQPMETAPKDREFLAVWGPKDPLPGEAFDVFIYDEDRKRFTFSGHGAHIYLDRDTHGPWAWMEIPKFEP